MRNIPQDWRTDESYIYIGRPSMWGNPYRVKVHGRITAIKLYKKNAITSTIISNLSKLEKKKLVCYCAPEPCHGDVLAALVNK